MSANIVPTPYQNAVLSIPESWNILMAGGRGGGKSTGMQLLVLRHIEKYGAAARPLLVRDTYKAAMELEDELDALLVQAYGKKVKHNRADHVLRCPSGAILEIGALDEANSYRRFQGRSFTFLGIEEAGLIKDMRWTRMLVSNLRAAPGIPLRTVMSANPGGPQHANLHQNYIARNLAWQPFETRDGETFVVCPSTYRDNPHIQHDDYLRKLRASCGSDEELLRAWTDGDWSIARGAFFAGSLDERVHMLPVAFKHAVTKDWRPYAAMDWGSSAPSVTYVCLRAPGDVGPWPKDSLLLVDELATCDPRDLNLGLQWPPAKLAEAVREMFARWGIPSVHGVGDDARGLETTLLQVLRDNKVYLQKPRKERVAGWAKVREMLHHAKERDGKPGLWVSARCKYFWQSVPFLPRDPTRPEDIETSGVPDHAADAVRYAVMHVHNYVRGGRTHGM